MYICVYIYINKNEQLLKVEEKEKYYVLDL